MSDNQFRREDRYIVIKLTDMEKAKSDLRSSFSVQCRKLHDSMLTRGAPARQFLVIESDWPEYEPVWKMIERRMSQPAAHLTIPGALEWDGDNGTHGADGADGESRGHGESSEVERLRMQLVACGVVAGANTPESAAKARDMHPDYMSASCQDVMRVVDREMDLRAKLAAEERQHLNTVDQRDLAEEMADKLANAVSELFRVEVGEHSSMSSPWTTALEVLDGDFKTDSDRDREVVSLRAQLDNTGQSRRSFFDLSQDLEKRLAERDALLKQAAGYGGLTPLWHAKVEQILSATPSPAKQKTCIECESEYCHGVCVERGDEHYDRDQAQKGDDQ